MKKDILWSRIFTVIGLIGFINFMSGYIGGQDLGYGSMLLILIFGSQIAMVGIIVFQLWFIWLILAYFLSRRGKNIENPSEENQKKYKVAKIVFITIAAIFIGLIAWGFLIAGR